MNSVPQLENQSHNLEQTALVLDAIKHDLESVLISVITQVESINYRNPKVNYLLADFEEDCAYLLNSINDLYPLYINQFVQYCYKKQAINK